MRLEKVFIVNQFFSKKRLVEFEYKSIIFKSKVVYRISFYRMKNKHSRTKVIEYSDKILSLDSEYKAIAWEG